VSAKYTLMLADVGCSVSAKYTPRSGAGITGVPGVDRTPSVEAHSPVCIALAVDGTCKGGYTLTATPTYFGGFQGACEFQWLRSAKDAAEGSAFVAIEGATEPTLDLAGSSRNRLQQPVVRVRPPHISSFQRVGAPHDVSTATCDLPSLIELFSDDVDDQGAEEARWDMRPVTRFHLKHITHTHTIQARGPRGTCPP